MTVKKHCFQELHLNPVLKGCIYIKNQSNGYFTQFGLGNYNTGIVLLLLMQQGNKNKKENKARLTRKGKKTFKQDYHFRKTCWIRSIVCKENF